MPALKKYPPELKERAVRLLLAAREDAGGARGASARIAQQLGIPADTLRKWLLRADIDYVSLTGSARKPPFQCQRHTSPITDLFLGFSGPTGLRPPTT
ncbi:hypothetical protein [Cryobacterium gelidum]|uniref:Transposase n=1 Tax=Cryobacterium gelidum TaxID=1259164 RepID=A0A4R9ASH9_9MICO|nr:hypothetical protein [Cryobacterium gelidum]TFD68136.1 hypothetical protein E3T50_13200 [Cryobacterium gelidum]